MLTEVVTMNELRVIKNYFRELQHKISKRIKWKNIAGARCLS